MSIIDYLKRSRKNKMKVIVSAKGKKKSPKASDAIPDSSGKFDELKKLNDKVLNVSINLYYLADRLYNEYREIINKNPKNTKEIKNHWEYSRAQVGDFFRKSNLKKSSSIDYFNILCQNLYENFNSNKVYNLSSTIYVILNESNPKNLIKKYLDVMEQVFNQYENLYFATNKVKIEKNSIPLLFNNIFENLNKLKINLTSDDIVIKNISENLNAKELKTSEISLMIDGLNKYYDIFKNADQNAIKINLVNIKNLISHFEELGKKIIQPENVFDSDNFKRILLHEGSRNFFHPITSHLYGLDFNEYARDIRIYDLSLLKDRKITIDNYILNYKINKNDTPELKEEKHNEIRLLKIAQQVLKEALEDVSNIPTQFKYIDKYKVLTNLGFKKSVLSLNLNYLANVDNFKDNLKKSLISKIGTTEDQSQIETIIKGNDFLEFPINYNLDLNIDSVNILNKNAINLNENLIQKYIIEYIIDEVKSKDTLNIISDLRSLDEKIISNIETKIDDEYSKELLEDGLDAVDKAKINIERFYFKNLFHKIKNSKKSEKFNIGDILPEQIKDIKYDSLNLFENFNIYYCEDIEKVIELIKSSNSIGNSLVENRIEKLNDFKILKEKVLNPLSQNRLIESIYESNADKNFVLTPSHLYDNLYSLNESILDKMKYQVRISSQESQSVIDKINTIIENKKQDINGSEFLTDYEKLIIQINLKDFPTETQNIFEKLFSDDISDNKEIKEFENKNYIKFINDSIYITDNLYKNNFLLYKYIYESIQEEIFDIEDKESLLNNFEEFSNDINLGDFSNFRIQSQNSIDFNDSFKYETIIELSNYFYNYLFKENQHLFDDNNTIIMLKNIIDDSFSDLSKIISYDFIENSRSLQFEDPEIDQYERVIDSNTRECLIILYAINNIVKLINVIEHFKLNEQKLQIHIQKLKNIVDVLNSRINDKSNNINLDRIPEALTSFKLALNNFRTQNKDREKQKGKPEKNLSLSEIAKIAQRNLKIQDRERCINAIRKLGEDENKLQEFFQDYKNIYYTIQYPLSGYFMDIEIHSVIDYKGEQQHYNQIKENQLSPPYILRNLFKTLENLWNAYNFDGFGKVVELMRTHIKNSYTIGELSIFALQHFNHHIHQFSSETNYYKKMMAENAPKDEKENKKDNFMTEELRSFFESRDPYYELNRIIEETVKDSYNNNTLKKFALQQKELELLKERKSRIIPFFEAVTLCYAALHIFESKYPDIFIWMNKIGIMSKNGYIYSNLNQRLYDELKKVHEYISGINELDEKTYRLGDEFITPDRDETLNEILKKRIEDTETLSYISKLNENQFENINFELTDTQRNNFISFGISEKLHLLYRKINEVFGSNENISPEIEQNIRIPLKSMESKMNNIYKKLQRIYNNS